MYSSVRVAGGFEKHASYLSKGQTLTHLEILEVKDFKPTLQVVTAEEMSAQIAQKGHVALSGIYFDTDSDALRPDSKPALEEIAKALEADGGLSLYVVGHTDDQGELAYNQALSQRRAMAVVQALSSDYGIAAERLTPLGVGPAAPVAVNDTEEGRSLNRGVELVRRAPAP